jgi:hypothetical protein
MRTLDIAALTGLAFGITAILQPWWQGGFRVGVFVTLGATVLHIVTSHLNVPEEE